MIEDFKKFILKGNLVTLAVAFIIGLKFAEVVTSFTDDIIQGIIAAIVGKTSFNGLTFELGNGIIKYGSFITVLLNFVITGFVLFLVVKAYEKAEEKMGVKKDDEAPTDVDLLSEIRDLLKAQRAS